MRRLVVLALLLAAPSSARGSAPAFRGLEMRLSPPPGTVAVGRCADLAPLLAGFGGHRVACLDHGSDLFVDLPGSRPLRLTLSAPSPESFERSVARTVDGLVAGRLGLAGPEAFEAGRLVFAAGLSPGSRLVLSPTGVFRDRLTGRRLDFEDAFALYRGMIPGKPRVGLAAAEVAGALAAGSLWYWTATGVNAPDWQYTYFGDSLYRKLVTFEAWRFDDNTIHLNSPGHALGGAAYYLLARSDGVGWGGAVAAAGVGSLAWELIPEYRELLGINDLILGTFGGTAVGESFFDLGRFFAQARGPGIWRVLAAVFGAPDAVEEWLTGRPPTPALETDAYGLPTDVPHTLEWSIGTLLTERLAADPWRADVETRLSVELFRLPEHLAPVTVSRFVATPARTRLNLDLAYGPSGLLEVAFEANTVLFGWHEEAMVDGPSGRRGHALLLGFATDFRHAERPGLGMTEFAGVAGLFGPVVDLTVLDGPWRLRIDGELYPDFALVRSLALPAYARTHDLSGAKTVLREQGYYMARGVTAFGRLALGRGPVSVGAEVAADRFDSIEGLDRYQAKVTDDFHLVDTRLDLSAFVELKVPRTATVLTLRYLAWHRTGAIRSVSTIDDQRAVSFLIGWRL